MRELVFETGEDTGIRRQSWYLGDNPIGESLTTNGNWHLGEFVPHRNLQQRRGETVAQPFTVIVSFFGIESNDGLGITSRQSMAEDLQHHRAQRIQNFVADMNSCIKEC